MQKNVLVSLSVVAALIAAIVGWHAWVTRHTTSPLNSSGQPPAITMDFDSFQTALADRVRTRFNVPEHSVVVADVAYDVGTLLDPIQSYPSNDSDCLPKPGPPVRTAENLFPSYQLSSDTAVQTTLGSGALQKLTSASLNLTHKSSLVYSIDEVSVQFMDVRTLEQLAAAGACSSYVAQHPGVRLIRGVVMGRISFTTKADNPGKVEADLKGIGGGSISTNPNSSTVTVSDDKSTQILQMLAVIGPPQPSPASRPVILPSRPAPDRSPASVKPSDAPSPKASNFVARVYLQQDAADAPEIGTKFAKDLQANWPNAQVIQKVERIPSAKMPGGAQVRFFNAADADIANRCRDHLKAIGLDARIVRIGLGAPQGQLEVWLPKSGT